ncbi:hypothetical protein [uncultured Sphingomonas sp.]|uniref:hypothetical protein n=1 Tax=uncultured Sphingomonas sp. TaxID=158754 RepID=UPI00260B7C7C|nr:hypothetical protein [uncultured Sphingomonas sp.]
MPRESITGLGWALTATIWLLAGLMVLSTFVGGCLPASGDACPTGDERMTTLLWIIAAALALNLSVATLVAYLRQRDARDRKRR